MSQLNKLKDATTLSDLAFLLGYQPKSLSYILYKIQPDKKYTCFTIPKKSGGSRDIQAPIEKLKTLQKCLSDLLYECVEETLPSDEQVKKGKNKKNRKRANKAIAHGFKKDLSIASNAELHQRKKHVLNLDLSNFFPSINFGRVRGYFIKNKHFELNPAIATIIAQIACHDNSLPQGSPCSPIISNLITQILDVRLVQLAKQYKCTYSRYADDLTFSTNFKQFPKELAYKKDNEHTNWIIGEKLSNYIERSGFTINHSKTRMQHANSRQVVTGLVVNRIVNTKIEYYRYARSMCHTLFMTGVFHLPEPIIEKQKNLEKPTVYDAIEAEDSAKIGSPSLNQLEGILSFIFQIKKHRNKYSDDGYRASQTDNKKYPPNDRCNQYSDKSHKTSIDGIRNLYSKFLFFKHFHALEKPLIFCEGKTDKIYIKCALKQLHTEYPTLTIKKENTIDLNINFFNHTKTVHELLNIAEGTSGMGYLISSYKRLIERYKCHGKRHPIIMLIDNDDGAHIIFSKILEIKYPCKGMNKRDKQALRKANKITGEKPYHHVVENLYVIVIPKINDKETKIEDYFDKKTLGATIGEKTFNSTNSNSGNSNQYGKHIFAEKIIKPNQSTIDFNSFKTILTPIASVIADYEKKQLDNKNCSESIIK